MEDAAGRDSEVSVGELRWRPNSDFQSQGEKIPTRSEDSFQDRNRLGQPNGHARGIWTLEILK